MPTATAPAAATAGSSRVHDLAALLGPDAHRRREAVLAREASPRSVQRWLVVRTARPAAPGMGDAARVGRRLDRARTRGDRLHGRAAQPHQRPRRPRRDRPSEVPAGRRPCRPRTGCARPGGCGPPLPAPLRRSTPSRAAWRRPTVARAFVDPWGAARTAATVTAMRSTASPATRVLRATRERPATVADVEAELTAVPRLAGSRRSVELLIGRPSRQHRATCELLGLRSAARDAGRPGRRCSTRRPRLRFGPRSTPPGPRSGWPWSSTAPRTTPTARLAARSTSGRRPGRARLGGAALQLCRRHRPPVGAAGAGRGRERGGRRHDGPPAPCRAPGMAARRSDPPWPP